MANPKKPTKIKVIQGTFRQHRAPKNEPKPSPISEDPRPPAWLPPAGKKLWKHLVPQLRTLGLLSDLYLPTLEATCLSYGIMVGSWRVIKATKRELPDGRVLRGRQAYLHGQNSQTIPELIAMQKAQASFGSYLGRFGLSPSDMSSIDLPDIPKEADPMERLVNED